MHIKKMKILVSEIVEKAKELYDYNEHNKLWNAVSPYFFRFFALRKNKDKKNEARKIVMKNNFIASFKILQLNLLLNKIKLKKTKTKFITNFAIKEMVSGYYFNMIKNVVIIQKYLNIFLNQEKILDKINLNYMNNNTTETNEETDINNNKEDKNTLFPSKTSEEGEVKGGVVLVKLKEKSKNINGKIDLEVSYKDRNEKEYSNSQTINFDKSKNDKEEFYDNSGIRKAIVLTRYVNILKNWILYERTENQIFMLGPNKGIVDIFYTEEETTKLLGEHERRSVNLTVSQEYKEIFKQLKGYILKENEEIKDEILNKEIEILDMLITKE